MSLEQALAANTAALDNLAKLYAAVIGTPQAVAQAPSHPAPAAAGGNQAPSAQPVAAPVAAAAAVQPLTFPDLETRFRKLVASNREKAVALLAKLGVAKLSLAKLEQYPVIDAELKVSGA